MFINPMWFSESHRLGMQRCTRLGSFVRSVSDLIGLFSLLFLIGSAIYLIYRGVVGSFRLSDLWLLAAPFASAFVGSFLNLFSLYLAGKKHFRYDYESDTATWTEKGMQYSYTSRQSMNTHG